jgi:hypothetical protein
LIGALLAMPRITISYRRDDTLDITGRIFDRLAGHFGREAVFRDIDSIPPGADFRRHIDRVLDESDVILAIVGPRWIGPNKKQLRLASPADPVRLEIETALRKDKPLIPVLVSRAVMPHPDVLPASIQDFVYRNAVQVDSGQDFDVHVGRLIRAIERLLRIDEGREPAKAQQEEQARPRARIRNPDGRPHKRLAAAAKSQDGDALTSGNAALESKDYAEAMRWYRKAADQGDAAAQANIGLLYRNGWGVAQDYAEAMRWYRKAADQGNTTGQHNIGWLYRNGWGVAQDDAEAMRWYRKAADQGAVIAQKNVGWFYQNGFGVAQDYAEAMRWYRRAADQGDADAKNSLMELEKRAGHPQH